MGTFLRFLTSQRLGRVTVTVEVNEAGSGEVKLLPDGVMTKALRFGFSAAVAHSEQRRGEWPERVIRLAVFQAHRLFVRQRNLPDSLLTLDMTTPRWNGDLLPTPYGGATAGIEKKRN